MMKRLLLLIILAAFSNVLLASVDVNKADQSALESISGIGAKRAKSIIDERSKNGAFKDMNDLSVRVKGIGKKSLVKLQENGLTISGQNSVAAPNNPKVPRNSTKNVGARAAKPTPGESK